ncbi:helix-turn-helix domain-containing protein [Paenibacillus sp. GCM10027628]|uniref:helix-turn-helix domain-containing protein n=1 Tax=Paenibacillus sp. GCM10027628 TaxID=3273413 RepID=UPI00362E390F
MGRTWFYRLLFSYMPVFFIVVTFIFFVFFQMLSEQSRNEALNANKTLSMQAIRLIDSSLKAVDNMVMLEIINSPELSKFYNDPNGTDAYITIQAVKKLQDMMTSNPIIDSIYLIRLKDQFVISTSTRDTLEHYLDAPFIKSHMESPNAKQWTGVRNFQEFTVKESKHVVSLVRGAPFITGTDGLLVVNVATDSLDKMIADLYNPKTSFIHITDANGKSLFDNQNHSGKLEVSSKFVSSYTGWSYESGLMGGGWIRVVMNLYNVWFMIGILMIVLGLVWMIYVTRRNYKPLEQIVARIRNYTVPLTHTFSKESKVDEFTFIESALVNMIEQSNQFQKKHEEDLHLRKRYLFYQLIEGEPPLSRDDWNEEAINLYLPRPSERQIVAVIEIDKYTKICQDYSQRDLNLLKFALRSVIQEFAQKISCMLLTEWTSAFQLSAIIDYGTNEEASDQDIHLLFDNIRSWVESNLKFTIAIGVGETAVRMADIPRSYKSAMEALKYKIMLGENRIIRYEDIVSHGQIEVFSHLNAIRAFVHSFRLQEECWKDKYDGLFNSLKQGLLTKDEIIHLMNYLTYYLGREMSGMAKEFKELWEHKGLPGLSERMESFQSLDEMRQHIENELVDFAAALKRVQDERNHASTIREVRKYIEQNFRNPNLSLDHLSEEFHIHAKYLSKLFKEETGRKFVDFLIDARMEYAKKQISETNDPVQHIAENAGYTNAISFSRVFKKIVGLSPTEYREEITRQVSR